MGKPEAERVGLQLSPKKSVQPRAFRVHRGPGRDPEVAVRVDLAAPGPVRSKGLKHLSKLPLPGFQEFPEDPADWFHWGGGRERGVTLKQVQHSVVQ